MPVITTPAAGNFEFGTYGRSGSLTIFGAKIAGTGTPGARIGVYIGSVDGTANYYASKGNRLGYPQNTNIFVDSTGHWSTGTTAVAGAYRITAYQEITPGQPSAYVSTDFTLAGDVDSIPVPVVTYPAFGGKVVGPAVPGYGGSYVGYTIRGTGVPGSRVGLYVADPTTTARYLQGCAPTDTDCQFELPPLSATVKADGTWSYPTDGSPGTYAVAVYQEVAPGSPSRFSAVTRFTVADSTTAPAGELAFTGSTGTGPLLWASLAAVLAGGALLLITRRRRAA